MERGPVANAQAGNPAGSAIGTDELHQRLHAVKEPPRARRRTNNRIRPDRQNVILRRGLVAKCGTALLPARANRQSENVAFALDRADFRHGQSGPFQFIANQPAEQFNLTGRCFQDQRPIEVKQALFDLHLLGKRNEPQRGDFGT